MSYALTTLWHERQRYLPAVLAVAFSCLLIALQCGLLLGLFSITSIPIDESSADLWVGHPEVPSVDLGIASPAGPYLFCSLDTARKLLRPPAEQCTFILAKCHNKEDAPKVVKALEAYPTKLGPFTTEDFSKHSRLHWLFKTKAGIALGLAALLGLMVGAVVTSTTLHSATSASLKEYAVLRALGIPRWRMSMMVVSQSFWVGIAGVALAFPAIFGIAYL